jgi:hypothetical protein
MIRMKQFGWYAVMLITTIVGVALAVYVVPENEDITGVLDDFPREFGGFWLTSTITGEEAISSVEQMHVGSPGAMEGAVIAIYRDESNRKVQLWIADFRNKEVATSTLLDMVEGIKRYPDLGFTVPEKRILNGVEVYVSEGAGGVNAFWVRGSRVVYLLIFHESLDDAVRIMGTFMNQYR